MAWQAVRKFNGACDPHWSTPEGQAEWGGYPTFDHHLGGGTFEDAVNAIRAFFGEMPSRWAKFKWAPRWDRARERGEYDAIMAELSNPTPRPFSFVYDQDIFEVSGTVGDPGRTGVRNFNDPRINFENGKIVRSDGKVRKGWRWV